MSSDSAEAKLLPSGRAASRKNFAWLAVTGIGFWFLVGFPFGNHNESYRWVSLFERHSLWDMVRTHHALAVTFRPLGQGLAYVGWQLSGGSSWPVQLFNFVVAAFALCAIALTIEETATFAIAMAITGGTFFTGFIYLFHLHGIFYSPVLIVIAALLRIDQGAIWSASRRELVIFACAFAVGLLFHPYALILFLAYVSGRILERWKDSSLADQAQRLLLALLSIIALVVTRPHGHEVLSYANLRGFVVSYQMTEITPILSIFSGIFAVATLVGMERLGHNFRIGLAGAAIFCAAALAFFGLPILLIWVAAAVFKLSYLRKWSLASMTSAAALLPGIAPSGSPTYAIFVLLLCVIALAWRWSSAEQALMRLGDRWIFVVVFVALLVGGALRMGVTLPVASRFARPVLVEQERTKQLETIIEWVLASEYRQWNVKLESPANPIDAGEWAIDRTHRPPTFQDYLDSYLASRRNSPSDPRTLVVTFGDRQLGSMTKVYTVPGRFAGAAIIFK